MSASKKIILCYPSSPKSKKVGGILTFIKCFVKYAPANFDIYWIGVSPEPDTGKWKQIDYEGNKINFLSVLSVSDENRRSLIPLSLRFIFKIFCYSIPKVDTVLINRLHFFLPFYFTPAFRIIGYHNDYVKILSGKESETFWSKMPFLFHLLEKLTLKKFHLVFSVNSNTTQYLQQQRNIREVLFLPTWADADIFYPEKSAPVSYAQLFNQNELDSLTKVLFVGRFQLQKNPELSLRVIKKYQELFPEDKIAFLMIGEGNMKTRLEELIQEMDLTSSVRILGFQSQEKLRSYYSAADLTLLTSFYEGMPSCLIESMACGTPFVSSPCTEVFKILGDSSAGIIIKDDQEDSYALAIKEIVKQKDKFKAASVERAKVFQPGPILASIYERIDAVSSKT